MKRIGKKLKSRDGASILFAILVFMLCILAGTAALTAAAANSGRYTHLKAEQQKYLTVSSAAKMLRDQIAGKELDVEIKTTTVAVGSISSMNFSGTIDDPDNEFYQKILKGMLDKPAVGVSCAVTLQISGTATVDKEFADVTADLTIDSGFNVTFEVYIPRTVTGGDTAKDYCTVVKIPAVKTGSGSVVDPSGTTETYKVTWAKESASIERLWETTT